VGSGEWGVEILIFFACEGTPVKKPSFFCTEHGCFFKKPRVFYAGGSADRGITGTVY